MRYNVNEPLKKPLPDSNEDKRPPVVEDDPTGPIDRFRGPYSFLSNFHPCKVWLGVYSYSTTEAAYQAAKTHDKQQQWEIRATGSPFLAKRLGRNVTLRADWKKVKREIMLDLLYQKFVVNQEFRQKLLATGDRELIEGGVNDDFWGVDKFGHGHNYLGKMLMAIRALLQLAIVTSNEK